MREMMLAILSAALLSGCATRGFVTERVDDRRRPPVFTSRC